VWGRTTGEATGAGPGGEATGAGPGLRSPQPWALVPGHFFIFFIFFGGSSFFSRLGCGQDEVDFFDKSLSSLSRLR
jgi:hypothetical protein